MINHDFFNALEEFCEERDLEKAQILDAIEKGIVNAYKKELKIEDKLKLNAKVSFNEEKGEIFIYRYYDVVTEEEKNSETEEDLSKVTLEEAKKLKRTAKLGDHLEIKINVNPKDFGRIALGTTKNILNQEINRLEKEKSFNYFSQHEGEMVTGTIIAINDSQITLDLGYEVRVKVSRIEIPREECRIGGRVKVYLSKVEMDKRGLRVYVSRSDKNLIKKLFEDYIPEIQDGTVEIVGIARDAGDRTKVCVKSSSPDVDALGSCLGPKGKRIKDIIDSLNGEKVDIYEWSDNPKDLVINALKPAEVFGVQFNEAEKQATAIVPDDQLSLAIGKRGQNAKLAVQSSGWKIDIKSVQQALDEGIDF